MDDMLDAQVLIELRLGTLKDAVDDWKTMADRLHLLAVGGDGAVSARDLAGKANAADWKGVNATVSRTFVTKTAGQFDDAVAEAKSVLGILSDAHGRLGKCQKDLQAAIDELLNRKIRVMPSGTVTYVGPSSPVVDTGKDPEVPSQEDLDLAQQRINKILWEATETDRIAARALRALAAKKYDFTDTGANSLKDADRQQGKADADKWLKEIAKGDVGSWSDEKLAGFNQMLKNQRDNPAFTETFVTGLGADGTLQLWRDLAAPATGSHDGNSAKTLARIQDNLSLTLAGATHLDGPAMDAWKKDLIAAGSKTFPLLADPAPVGMGVAGGAPTGFQIMSSLMKEGNYESKFLQDYGAALVAYERKGSLEPDEMWTDITSLDYPESKTPKPNDPMIGYLEALGHNPQASLEFFSDFTGTGADRIDNFDYLTGSGNGDTREWITLPDRKPIGFDSLGHALESATLGYAYDALEPKIPRLDTVAQVEARESRLDLFERVIGAYSSPEGIEKQSGIEGSLGKIAAGHIDSLDYSLYDWGDFPEAVEPDQLFKSTHLRDVGTAQALGFLRAVASDGDSYDTISAAQQVYGTSLIAAHGDHQADAVEAGLFNVKMHGLLDEAHAEGLGREYNDLEKARNIALEQQAAWREFGVSAALGVGVGAVSSLVEPAGGAAAIAVPLAFETVGAAGETAMGNHMIEWLDENEYHNDEEVIKELDKEKTAGFHNAAVPLVNYLSDQGVDRVGFRNVLADAEDRYNAGVTQADTDNERGF